MWRDSTLTGHLANLHACLFVQYILCFFTFLQVKIKVILNKVCMFHVTVPILIFVIMYVGVTYVPSNKAFVKTLNTASFIL